MMIELQKSYGEELQQRIVSLFPFLQEMAIFFALTRIILFLSKIPEVERVIRRNRKCLLCQESKRTSVLQKQFVCKRCRGFRNRLFSQINGKENYPHSLDERAIKILFKLESEALPIEKVSSSTEIPVSTAYKIVSRLINGGFIEKKDMLYFLTESAKIKIINLKGWDLERFFVRNKSEKKPCLRFHALQGKLIVVNSPLDYNKYIDRSYPEYFNKVIRIPVGRCKKETGFKLEVSSCLIVFYNPTSISITFPDILIDNLGIHRVAEGYCKLGLFVDTVIEKLEKMFRGLQIDSFYAFGLDNQHIAIKDSKYASRNYKKNRGDLKENKIIIDNSHGHLELEAVNPLTAGQDIEECLRLEKEVLESTSEEQK